MLSVDERHALIQLQTAALRAAQAHHCTSHDGSALDRVLRGLQARDDATHRLMEYINQVTDWGQHPAAGGTS